MPVASSSVRLALKTFLIPPKCSTSLRPFVGPKPGVRLSASQCRLVSSAGLKLTAASATHTSLSTCRTLYTRQNRCQGCMTHCFVKIEHNRMRRLRISAISYLNTAPLMWDFEHGPIGREFEISYTSPSQCAAALREGSADIGIIPAAAYATIPNF